MLEPKTILLEHEGTTNLKQDLKERERGGGEGEKKRIQQFWVFEVDFFVSICCSQNLKPAIYFLVKSPSFQWCKTDIFLNLYERRAKSKTTLKEQ